ncbi:hypothetical protein KPL37_16725 [Clostridium frigoris]|uniref:Uncharacterized protein n=1 Tax=Clostridium frigoris TaxID=205327 RepID=A0ABS6BXN4_9CLOT|nr:hypothetical protein [Clostridium frigoris]MBU3161354.1 hypothetical protein [Clostridium frigoris]
MTTINMNDVVIGITLGMVVFVLLELCIIIYVSNRCNVSLDYDKELDEIMCNAYLQAKVKNGDVKLVQGFNVVKNTLPFDNITIDPNDGGNCLGYCYVTRELFQNSLIKILRKRFKEIYDVSFLMDSELNDFTIKVVKTKNKIKYEVSQNVFEILKALTYYQRRLNGYLSMYRSDQVMPKTYSDNGSAIRYHNRYLLSKIRIFKSNMCKTMDLNKLILSKIDSNKLVIVCMGGHDKNIAHCVLAYKYELIGDEEIKIFVYDSNIPITEDNDVSQFIFILFKLVKGEWQYTYRPSIEKDIYIDYNFNSYVPGATIIFM